MNFSVFSDIHANNFKQFSKLVGGLNSRLLDAGAALNHIADYNVKNNIKVTLFAGDLFHTFSHVENDVMVYVAEIISKWPGRFVYVFGQHDLKVKEVCGKRFAGTTVFEKMGAILLDGELTGGHVAGLSVYGLGWRVPAEFLRLAGENKADVLLGHFLPPNKSIPGGTYIPSAVAANYKLMVLGDLHIPGYFADAKLLVPGAPMQHNFGDEGQERGFWTVDTETWKPVFHPIDFTPKFHTVQYVEDVPAFTAVGGRTVPNIDFYRVERSTDAENLPENVVARRDTKQEFRESGVTSAMPDAALCAEYVKLQGPAEPSASALADYGKRVLERFESRALVPKDWHLTEVEISGFLSVRGRMKFEFKGGLHLVSGENGAGKTTLFEAVKWCLDGTTTKGVGADDVVNDSDGDGCEVFVRFKDPAGRTLGVRRTRTEFEFAVTGENVVRRESQAATREELQRVLGMDETMFKNVCYFSQKDFEFFSTMTDAGQKALCKSIRQIDRFEEAETEAKRLRDAARSSLDGVRRDTEMNEARLAETLSSVEGLEKLVEAFEIDRSRRLADMGEKERERRVEIDSLGPKLLVVEDELKDLEVRKAAVPLAGVPQELRVVVDGAKRKLQESVESRKAGMTSMDSDLHAAQCVVRELMAKAAAADGGLKAAQDEGLLLANQIGTLMAVGKCPMCGQQVKDDSVLDKLEGKRSEVEAKAFKAMDSKCQLAEELKGATEREGALREEWGRSDAGYEAARSQLDAELRAAETALSEAVRAAEARRAADMAEIGLEVAGLKERLRAIGDALQRAKEDAASLCRDIDALRGLPNRAAGNLMVARGAAEGYGKILVESKEKAKGLEGELSMAEFWAKGFSDQGLVSYLLDGFAKEFTEAANVALLELSGGRFSVALSTQRKLRGKDEWRERFELSVYVDGKRRPYKALSGGQQARVNLAAAVALTEVVKGQFGLAGHPLGVVILDELITELDAEGAEMMYGVLGRLAAGGCAVYAVSHNDNFKSLFPDVVSVRYDKENKTTVVDI